MSNQSPTLPLTVQWNQLCLEAIVCTKATPPAAARSLAMLHTAMYDAWSVYDQCAISTTTARMIKRKPDHCRGQHILISISYAAYRVLCNVFVCDLPAEKKTVFSEFMCSLGYPTEEITLDIHTPEGIGNLMGKLVIEYRLGDGSNGKGTVHMPPYSDYTGYTSVNSSTQVNDINFWRPQSIEIAKGCYHDQVFLAPHWGLVRSFSFSYNWQHRPAPPFRKYQVEFGQQAKEVLDVSANLSDQQKMIVEYWADGPGTKTPPGHWFDIAQFIATEKHVYSDEQCIKLYFALGNAMLDVSISCWESKWYYNSARPVTAIREIYRGQQVEAWGGPCKGKQTIKGEHWNPYLLTPPFPEHVSGHSSFSKAAATILKSFTGKDDFGGCVTREKGTSVIEPNCTPAESIRLEWPTFSAAAEQAGISRHYGGIHFMRGNVDGQTLGAAVGRSVWEKVLFYLNE